MNGRWMQQLGRQRQRLAHIIRLSHEDWRLLWEKKGEGEEEEEEEEEEEKEERIRKAAATSLFDGFTETRNKSQWITRKKERSQGEERKERGE